ncbi:MAG: hypothetical protein HWE35_03470 [Rhodobacteraceae bacterium]|nr:hypothetical protein [Paracoccaceae bacterium]
MTPAEEVQAKKLAKLILPSIPGDYAGDAVAVSAWLWLSPDGKGAGGGARAYDPLGHSTGFSFPLQPLLPVLNTLRAVHPEHETRLWKTVLLQFGRKAHELELSFEFDDPYCWMVTEENFKSVLPVLRPRFLQST